MNTTSHKLRRGCLTANSVLWVIKCGASLCGTEVIPFSSKIPKGKLSFNHLRYGSFYGWHFIASNRKYFSESPTVWLYWSLWRLTEMTFTMCLSLFVIFLFSAMDILLTCNVEIIVFWSLFHSCLTITLTYWALRDPKDPYHSSFTRLFVISLHNNCRNVRLKPTSYLHYQDECIYIMALVFVRCIKHASYSTASSPIL